MSRRLVFGLPRHQVIVIDRFPKRRRITSDQVVMTACLVFLAAMILWRCAL